MALLHHDELEEILGKKFSTYRNQIWLWHFLDNPFGTLHQGAFGPGARDCMARHLKNRPELKNSIFNSVGESFLPDVEFDWIGGGERQNEFVLKDMISRLGWVTLHNSLVGRERTIAMVDASPVSFSSKKFALTCAKNAWAQHIESDRFFRWFGARDEEVRCKFLWDWLSKNRLDYVRNKIPFTEVGSALLFFDRLLVSASERELIADKVKKAFSLRKHRDNQNGKKQCNLMLHERTINMLEKMAGTYGLSKAEVLEILIQDEWSRKVYISARLERYENLVQQNLANKLDGRSSI